MPKKQQVVERVFIFIDGSNFYHGVKKFIGDIPFPPEAIRKLAEKLCGERRLVKIL